VLRNIVCASIQFQLREKLAAFSIARNFYFYFHSRNIPARVILFSRLGRGQKFTTELWLNEQADSVPEPRPGINLAPVTLFM